MVLSHDSHFDLLRLYQRDARLDGLGHRRDQEHPYSGLKGLDESLICWNAMGQEFEMSIELSLLSRKSMVLRATAELRDEHSS